MLAPVPVSTTVSQGVQLKKEQTWLLRDSQGFWLGGSYLTGAPNFVFHRSSILLAFISCE